MNIGTVILKLQETKDLIIRQRKIVLGLAINGILAEMSTRIFTSGINAQGNGIGKYSPKYIPIRKKRNRQTSFVDLNFEGLLKSDFETSLKWTGNKYVIGTKREKNSIKMEAMEDRFGNIFDLTNAERKNYFNDLLSIINEEIKEIWQ
jgi:hypothetical protein